LAKRKHKTTLSWKNQPAIVSAFIGAIAILVASVINVLFSNNQPSVVQHNNGNGQGIVNTSPESISIGISFKEYNIALAKKENEIRQLLVNDALNEKEISLLSKKLGDIEYQRRNERSSYESYISILRQQIISLNKFPDKLFKEAQQSLINGNSKKAKKLFTQIENQADNHLKNSAEAAFQRGMLAKKDFEYVESHIAFKKAVRLQPKNVRYLVRLAQISQVLDMHEKALDYLLLALELNDEGGIDEIDSLRGIGSIYYSLGQYNKAAEYAELSLIKSIKMYGEEHLSVALSRNNLGSLYVVLGDFDKALEYFQLALKYLTKTFGKKHPTIHTIHNNLAQYYIKKSQLPKARDQLLLALESSVAVLGLNHPMVAIYHSNLGNVFGRLGMTDKAIEYLQFALKSDLNNFGKNHSYVARDHNGLGAVYISLGEIEKGIEHFEKSLNVISGLLGYNHPHTKIAKYNLVDAKKRLLDK